MIQNQHQHIISNSKLNELKQSLANLVDNPDRLAERLFQAQKAGLQVWIDRIETEIAEYNRSPQSKL